MIYYPSQTVIRNVNPVLHSPYNNIAQTPQSHRLLNRVPQSPQHSNQVISFNVPSQITGLQNNSSFTGSLMSSPTKYSSAYSINSQGPILCSPRSTMATHRFQDKSMLSNPFQIYNTQDFQSPQREQKISNQNSFIQNPAISNQTKQLDSPSQNYYNQNQYFEKVKVKEIKTQGQQQKPRTPNLDDSQETTVEVKENREPLVFNKNFNFMPDQANKNKIFRESQSSQNYFIPVTFNQDTPIADTKNIFGKNSNKKHQNFQQESLGDNSPTENVEVSELYNEINSLRRRVQMLEQLQGKQKRLIDMLIKKNEKLVEQNRSLQQNQYQKRNAGGSPSSVLYDSTNFDYDNPSQSQNLGDQEIDYDS